MIVSLHDPRVELYAKLYNVSLEQAKKIVERKEDEKEQEKKIQNKQFSQDKPEYLVNVLNYYANYNLAFVIKYNEQQNNRSYVDLNLMNG